MLVRPSCYSVTDRHYCLAGVQMVERRSWLYSDAFALQHTGAAEPLVVLIYIRGFREWTIWTHCTVDTHLANIVPRVFRIFRYITWKCSPRHRYHLEWRSIASASPAIMTGMGTSLSSYLSRPRQESLRRHSDFIDWQSTTATQRGNQ